MKILVVDDDKMSRDFIQRCLSPLNHELSFAVSGRNALESATINKPDLIISDISMPEMDGYEFIKELRKNPEFKFIPFIFLSSLDDRDSIRKGMNFSADDYITKPFTRKEICDAVNIRLERFVLSNIAISSGLKNLSSELINSIAENGVENLDDYLLEVSNRLKEKEILIKEANFLNSHLIRGPLSSILSIIELLKKEKYNKDLIENLEKSGNTLDLMIHKLNEVLATDIYGNTGDWHKIQSKPLSIMMVDDDPIQHHVNTFLLHDFNPKMKIYSYLESLHALESLQMNKAKVDLILLDILMPDMDCWAFLNRMNASGITIDVVLLSSSIDQEDHKKARLYTQVKNFLIKPLTVQSFNSIFE